MRLGECGDAIGFNVTGRERVTGVFFGLLLSPRRQSAYVITACILKGGKAAAPGILYAAA